MLNGTSLKELSILMYSVHTHPFNGPFSWTTWVSQYQKGKTDLDFLKQETVSDSGISCAVCKSAPCSRQITTPAPHHCFYRRDALPTNSTEGNVRHTIQNDKSCCKTAHIFGRDAIESRRSRESYLTNFTNWLQCLRCLDTVGWASGRASGL